MANKRISELASITAPDAADLLLLADISANESKKLTLQNLGTFLLLSPNVSANISGSLYGSASYALRALTSSYTDVQSASYASTSSFALNVVPTISSSWASSSISSSYAITASFVLLSNADSASVATSAIYSNTASFLYYGGADNGTASYALVTGMSDTSTNSTSASHADISDYTLLSDISLATLYASTATSASYASSSDSASYTPYALYADSAGTAVVGVIVTTNFQSSASWASKSLYSDLSITSTTAIFATSASYAPPLTSLLYSKGIYLAISQSTSSSQLDVVNINPYSGQAASSSVEAVGTVIAYYTSSTILDESITLFALNREGGALNLLDSTPIYVNLSNSDNSGSIKMPYSLIGQASMTGSYMIYVSASSNNIALEPTRLTRFNIVSSYGDFSVSAGGSIKLMSDNTSDLVSYTHAGPTTYVGTAAQLVAAGPTSSIKLQATSSTSNLHYIWTLTNLRELDCTNNANITNLGGMPRSIITMSLSSCNLYGLYSLANTSASILDVTNNQISTVNFLPASMSYLNISNNSGITTMPSAMPYGLKNLYWDTTNITEIPGAPFDLPDSIVSMSFNNNPNLSSWLAQLPVSLGWFECNYNVSLTALPSILISPSLLYLDVSWGGFTQVAIDNICSNLVSNGQSNGTLLIQGNASALPYLSSTTTNINTLENVRGWTVTY